MELHPLGDRALLVRLGDSIDAATHRRVRALCARLEARPPPGLTEYVPAYASVAVHYAPAALPPGRAPHQQTADALGAALSARDDAEPPPPRVVELPVLYGGEAGPDLEELARHHGLTPEEVVRLHTAGDYLVYMLGFAPGFPYLGGLDERLATPRRATPRTHVPAGSVGIGGAQTGVYPIDSPGGWHLIGRTPLRLFDPQADPPTLLRMGDRVRFVRQDSGFTDGLPATGCRLPANPGVAGSWKPVAGSLFPESRILVLSAGLLTTVQDLGRAGHQREGVPVGGALDALALRVANLLVGNEPGAAGLELTLAGAVLRFEADTLLALAGADLGARLDDVALPPGRAGRAPAGATLTFERRRSGCRAYLAVAGGIDVPPVLGSRSTFVRAALGGLDGRALRAGDVLPLGRPSPLAETIAAALRRQGGEGVGVARWGVGRELQPTVAGSAHVRLLPGAHLAALTDAARQALFTAEFRVSPRSDRTGYRLDGPRLELAAALELLSEPVACGTVQLPPDGRPIVLLADRQTVGGYPRPGEVASVDLPLLAQLAPGDTLRFRACTLAEAQAALLAQERALARARAAVAVQVRGA